MFALVHEMRVRIMTAPAFTGDKVLGAILFEKTMDGEAQGQPVPAYLWKKRGVVPFLKVDKGLAAEADGVALMKPMPELPGLLDRAAGHGRVRHQDALRHPRRLARGHRRHRRAAVRGRGADRRARARADRRAGSVDQGARQGANARRCCASDLLAGLDALPADVGVMLKLTIPDVGLLRAAGRSPQGAAGRGAVGRLFAPRSLRAAGAAARHDRQLLARAGGGFEEAR